MEIQLFQVDAFTDELFKGNPAAICPLDEWLPDDLMQKIARENNLAETAFFVKNGSDLYLRWFTPEFEIDLCGHATLGSAHVLYEHLGFKGAEVHFKTLSGTLTVRKKGDEFEMDFPSRPPVATDTLIEFEHGLSIYPQEIMKSERDYFLVYKNEMEIRNLVANPGLFQRKKFGIGGIICTAIGDQVDFVSRFFMPGASVFEDPVTGSAHCTLVPYWSQRLGKSELEAIQLSDREGKIKCVNKENRILIAGKVVTYLKGEIFI
jgi:PhzF family phenazine biosynthesis protein